MRNAVYLAIVLWFIRRILRKTTQRKPNDSLVYGDYTFKVTFPPEMMKLALDGLQKELSDEIDRTVVAMLPSWKEFV